MSQATPSSLCRAPRRKALVARLLVTGLLVCAGTIAAPVFASDPSVLDPALGNTIVSTHPDGRKAKLWLKRDGTYSAQGRAGERSGGVWKVKGEKLCLSQRSPVPIPFSYCKLLPAVTVGKPWRDTAVTGEPVTNEIVPGNDASIDRRER